MFMLREPKHALQHQTSNNFRITKLFRLDKLDNKHVLESFQQAKMEALHEKRFDYNCKFKWKAFC